MGRDKKQPTKAKKGSKGSSKGDSGDLNEKLRAGEHLEDIDPLEVRFTHSKISPTFSCGRKLTDTLQEIVDGELRVAQLPKITVLYDKEGYMYSMNNRRLWTLKNLREKGGIPGNRISVRMRPLAHVKTKGASDRYNPERCSLSAKLMKTSTKPQDVSADVNQNINCDEAGVVDASLNSTTESPEKLVGESDL